MLVSQLFVGVTVVLALREHIVHKPDCEQVKVLYAKPQLDTP